ncbi:MAG: FHA domain-containing protein [Bryobacteraceae bacterium]|nr:FHA domain-containing protein [Bryobacteraceae bacterium]
MVRELVVIAPSGDSRRVPLNQDLITIGRSPTCDLAFPEDALLSRQHAGIRRSKAAWLITGLGSSNGTFLNGRRVASATTLTEGDRIQSSKHPARSRLWPSVAPSRQSVRHPALLRRRKYSQSASRAVLLPVSGRARTP